MSNGNFRKIQETMAAKWRERGDKFKFKIFQTGNQKSLLIIFEFEAAVVSVVGIVLCKSTSISLTMREREKRKIRRKGTRWRLVEGSSVEIWRPRATKTEGRGSKWRKRTFTSFPSSWRRRRRASPSSPGSTECRRTWSRTISWPLPA